MRYYKIVEDGVILCIGEGNGGTEISEAEYNSILSVIKSKQTQPGYEYHLLEDLTWEEIHVEPEPDIQDKAEAYDILVGGAT